MTTRDFPPAGSFAAHLATLGQLRPDLVQVKVSDCRRFYLPFDGHLLSLLAEETAPGELRFTTPAHEGQLQQHLQRAIVSQGWGFELFSQRGGETLVTVGTYYLDTMIEPISRALAPSAAQALTEAYAAALEQVSA